MKDHRKHVDKADYFKYVPPSSDAIAWGAYVTGAGSAEIPPDFDYPPRKHPSDHYFSWDKGRLLSKYQLVYIEKGQGVFQSSKSVEINIKDGDLMILFPFVWHRYRPDKDTGWTEYWVEFSGNYINGLMKNRNFKPESPVLKVGHGTELVRTYDEILDLISREPPDYQLLLGAKATYLIACLSSNQKKMNIAGRPAEEIIAEAKKMLLSSSDGHHVSHAELAASLKLDYNVFNDLFKLYTGFSPEQFLQQAAVIRAEGMLSGTDTPIEKIATDLGFRSGEAMAKIFVKQVGMTPEAFRLKTRDAVRP
jgi:AraC-like DNA-binding protein